MTHWLDFNKSLSRSTPKDKVVIYTKTFYNPGMYPNTSRPKILRSLEDFSLLELLELEAKLLPDPKKLRTPLAR